MPDVIVKQGVRVLNKVGAFAAFSNATGKRMFSGEYLTTAVIEITGTTQDTRAGLGNALIMQTHADRNVAITLTIKDCVLLAA